MTIAFNFISSIDNNKEHVIDSKYGNIKIIDSLKNRYQNDLESMKGSEFVFDHVHLLYYKCHKINPNHCRSYINSLDRTKIKKVTINLINKKDNKCFKYAVTVALNHGK